MTKARLFLTISVISLFFTAASPASFIWATDMGWYRSTGGSQQNSINYLVGDIEGIEYRNWFVFDLSGIGEIESATLRIFMVESPPASASGYNGDEFETLALWDVSTNADVLRSRIANYDVFTDLGSGMILGQIDATPHDAGFFVDISLNSTAIHSLSLADGLWAIGGSLITNDGNDTLFNYSNEDPRVILEYAVPEASTFLLFTFSLITLMIAIRRPFWSNLFGGLFARF